MINERRSESRKGWPALQPTPCTHLGPVPSLLRSLRQPAGSPPCSAALLLTHAPTDDLLHSAAARAYHTTSIPHHAGGF